MAESVEDVSSFSNDRIYVPIKIQEALGLHQGDQVIWSHVEHGFVIKKKK